MAQDSVLRPGGVGGARPGLPRVLVWLTDGVKPGDVIEPTAELREEGVAVLVVSTGHANYQVLSQVVSPPVESHLYFIDIDDMSIITEDLRDAIIGEFWWRWCVYVCVAEVIFRPTVNCSASSEWNTCSF